jgi:hypothetical protein
MKKHLIIIFALLFLALTQMADRKIIARQKAFAIGGQSLTTIDPGEFVGTVALGGFRMIAVNMLWIRAFENQEQNRHFSALADAELITKLQPGVPNVWSFIAWNLAYNISVMEDSEEEGYQWVKSGIETLKRGCDRASQSKSIWKLRQDLGWFYYHRVGPQFEDYYRKFLEDKELNPQGLNPLLLAVEQFDKACSHPNHHLTVDYLLYRSLLDCLSGLRLSKEKRQELHARVALIRQHLSKEHADPTMSQRLAFYDQQYQDVLRRERRR